MDFIWIVFKIKVMLNCVDLWNKEVQELILWEQPLNISPKYVSMSKSNKVSSVYYTARHLLCHHVGSDVNWQYELDYGIFPMYSVNLHLASKDQL